MDGLKYATLLRDTYPVDPKEKKHFSKVLSKHTTKFYIIFAKGVAYSAATWRDPDRQEKLS